MAKLEPLRTALSKVRNQPGLLLKIAADTFPADLGEARDFFATVLSASALNIERSGIKQLIESQPGKIIVQGLVGLFNMPKAELTMVFTEPETDQLDVDATIIIPKNVAVKIGHLPQLNLTSPTQDVLLGLKKTGTTFSMSLRGKEGEPIQLPGIAEVAKLTEGFEFANLLPESLVNVVNGIAFNELSADFDPLAKTVSKLDAKLQFLGPSASGSWQMGPGLQIDSLRFQIEVQNAVPAVGAERSASGAAFGHLKIGSVQMPLEIRSSNADASLWQAKIEENKTVELPTLAALLAPFLDTETMASLPPQLVDLPGITVNSLSLEFDPKTKTDPAEKTIKNLQFDIAAESEWPIVPDFLSVKNNTLHLRFENLLVSADRKVSGKATSSLNVADAAFQFSLDKPVDDEQWTIAGELAQGATIKIGTFAKAFLAAFTVPTDLPDFDIDTARFTLEMQSKRLRFESGSEQGLDIVSGFGIKGLGISFERAPGENPSDQAILSAALTGIITVADIDLNLKAGISSNRGATSKDLTFETKTAEGTDIAIGALINSLGAFGTLDLPSSISDASISNIRAICLPGKELNFGFVTKMETEVSSLELNILLKMTQNKGIWDKVFEGLLLAGDHEFEIEFSAESFFAALRPGEGGAVSLSDLMQRFVDAPEGLIPAISVSVKEAFFSYIKAGGAQKKGTLLFGVSVGMDMSFGDGLPLVGPMLNGQSIGVDSVLFTYTTNKLSLPKLRKLNLSLPKGKPKLPEVDMPSGISLNFSMAFGKLKQYIALPVAELPESSDSDQSIAPEAKPTVTAPEGEGKWFAVNKKLGPLSIARVGVNLNKDKVLSFGLDASLSLGPLTLLLEEFSFSSPIDRFQPAFGMRGFGITYSTGPVEISGFFLRKPTNEFAGAALIKTKTLTLKAVGAFAMVQGEPSFYLDAFLDYPIGGPAFFFVEGLAAGFGFNRSVTMPRIDKVKDFPLVAIAVGSKPFLAAAGEMASGNFVPIDPGKLFLAIGVRFTTFKQLNSFLLINASFGNGFRLDLLGLSKLTVPAPQPGQPAKTPLAEIELAIKGTFAPDEGFVGVQAQLTKNSYILSRDCSLTGGFAFFTWFGNNRHAGDFVISLGGYHPQFNRPAHYPVVPRLGFNWQVSSNINVKGAMYFALTPSVLMAGGRLEATFTSGGLKAWFIIGADFIIGWKPYFYDARLYMAMGVSYTFWFFGKQTVSFDIGAELHIWGPEFSGTAYIDLGIVDFTVDFGSGTSQTVNPIPYSEFKQTFLPATNVATVSATSGLLKEIGSGNDIIWVVNPKEFVLSTDSVIPSRSAPGLKDAAENALLPGNTDFGIGTVGVKKGQLDTQHIVTIFKGGDDFTAEFIYETATKSYPAALWGEQLVMDKNAARLIPDALSGVKIKPRPPQEPDQMGFLDQDEFKFQTLTIDNAFKVEDGLGFTKVDGAVNIPEIHSTRSKILSSLGFEPEIDFEIMVEDELGLTGSPVLGSYASAGLTPS